MNKLLVILLFFVPSFLFSQVIYTAGISYTNGVPSHNPGNTGSKYAIDTVNWNLYVRSAVATWSLVGDWLQPISGCSAPAYTPTKYQSVFVVNACTPPELYYWTGAIWEQLGGSGGVADGDYGDIDVSGSGTVWDIDTSTVGPIELQATAVTPGSYTNTSLTVDADGRITAASNGTAGILTASNGLTLTGSNVKLGGALVDAATQIDYNGNELRFFEGKTSFSSWTFADAATQLVRFQAEEFLPTTSTSPTFDGIVEFRVHSSTGSVQPNSLTIGGYPTDADGMWLQSRSASNPSFEYPLSLQPRGAGLSVGRTGGLDALVTFSGSGLSGSAAAGSILLLEHSEGNGKTSLGFGSGSDNLTGEMALFHTAQALRITNRASTNGTTSVRVALGGETSDVASFEKSAATSLVQFGVGTVTPHSTLQSAGSLATAYLETVGAPTFDETKRTVAYTASTNISWTLPAAASCACPGREYILHHAGNAGTITLSQSVLKGNGVTFNTLTAGQWAYIVYGASSIRGYKLTSL